MVRHAYLDVPIATYRPLDEFTTPPDVNGTVYRVTRELSADKGPDRHGDDGSYVSRVDRCDELVRRGWLLGEHSSEFRTGPPPQWILGLVLAASHRPGGALNAVAPVHGWWQHDREV